MHSIVQISGPTPFFSTSTLGPGSAVLHTFSQIGTYIFQDSVHPTLTCRVVVSGSTTTNTATTVTTTKASTTTTTTTTAGTTTKTQTAATVAANWPPTSSKVNVAAGGTVEWFILDANTHNLYVVIGGSTVSSGNLHQFGIYDLQFNTPGSYVVRDKFFASYTQTVVVTSAARRSIEERSPAGLNSAAASNAAAAASSLGYIVTGCILAVMVVAMVAFVARRSSNRQAVVLTQLTSAQ